jgi:hypothetical protein
MQRCARTIRCNSPETASNWRLRFDDVQAKSGGSLLEEPNLLLAMSFLVVLHALIHVLVPPPEHAID